MAIARGYIWYTCLAIAYTINREQRKRNQEPWTLPLNMEERTSGESKGVIGYIWVFLSDHKLFSLSLGSDPRGKT